MLKFDTFWADSCQDFQGQGSILAVTMMDLYVAYLAQYSRLKYVSLHTNTELIDVHIDTSCMKIQQIFRKLSAFERHDNTGP